MLRDFADLVRNLIGDSKVQKSSRKPADPLREALIAHGGRESGLEFLFKDYAEDDWNLGFIVLLLKNGKVWKLPGDNLYAMYRDYQMLAEIKGGSSIKDIVEHLGCAVVMFGAHVKVHMLRTANNLVVTKARELRQLVMAHNTAARAAHTNKLRDPDTLSFRVIAFEGEKIYRNAILR